MSLPDVLVAMPARNEQATVREALAGVGAALADARRHGVVGRTHVEVAAHRCHDRTFDEARSALAGMSSAQVLRDETSSTVGEVRHAAVLRGLDRLDRPPDSTWVLSTDADTVVGADWVRRILAEASVADAVAVVGLADIDRWQGAAHTEPAYASLLASKMRAPVGLWQHDHVYGANLAVRADAYLDCGGFPTVGHGEDQLLVDDLVRRGHRVARTRNVRVRTSGRLAGRADRGLAAHLHRLHLAGQVLPYTGTV